MPLARCAQYESTETRSRRARSIPMSLISSVEFGSGNMEAPPARVEYATTRFEVCYSVHELRVKIATRRLLYTFLRVLWLQFSPQKGIASR